MSRIACAATLTLGLSGCGSATPTRSPQARLKAICDAADNALLEIDSDKFKRSSGAATGREVEIAGSEIVRAAREAQAVDASTAAKVRGLPASPYTAPVLADLSHSQTALEEIIGRVRRRGLAPERFPRSLLVSFLRAGGGCGVVKLTNPTSD